MWAFIWHLRGSTPIPSGTADVEILDRVEMLLQRQYKTVTEKAATSIAFDNPLWASWFSPNWLAMVVYDRGRFWIDSAQGCRTLRYDLRSFHGFTFCLFAAVIFSIFGFFNGGVGTAVKYAAFAFGWLCGMNMVLAWTRIPRLIRKTVAGK